MRWSSQGGLKSTPSSDLARETSGIFSRRTGLEDSTCGAGAKRWKRDPENFGGPLEARRQLTQNMGRFREAADMLGAVVEKNGHHTMARFHLATTLKAQGLYSRRGCLRSRGNFAKSAGSILAQDRVRPRFVVQKNLPRSG